MKAMVLAAGLGTRLDGCAPELPKPMMPVGGKPVLAHNLELLALHGVRDVIVNLHHRAERIVEYCGDGSRFGLSITYSWEPVLLGTAGAVRHAAAEFQSSFFVVYGDNLSTCDLSRLRVYHHRCGGIATVAVFEREDPRTSGIVELDDDGRIRRFVEKPHPSEVFSRLVSAGILVLQPEAIAAIGEGVSDFGRDVFPELLARGLPVFGYRMSEQLWWIDTPVDYARAVQEFATRGVH